MHSAGAIASEIKRKKKNNDCHFLRSDPTFIISMDLDCSVPFYLTVPKKIKEIWSLLANGTREKNQAIGQPVVYLFPNHQAEWERAQTVVRAFF